MCTDCEDLTIPTGETGATGATGLTGAAGAAGTNGTNGTNGTSGTTILATYNSITGTGTPANLVETILFTTNLPANTLSTNGDELEIFIYSTFNSVTDAAIRFKLGSKIETYNYATAGPDVVISHFKIKISRISQTSQMWQVQEIVTDITGATYVRNVVNDTSTVDLGTILAFEVTGQNGTTSIAEQLVVKKVTIYKYKI